MMEIPAQHCADILRVPVNRLFGIPFTPITPPTAFAQPMLTPPTPPQSPFLQGEQQTAWQQQQQHVIHWQSQQWVPTQLPQQSPRQLPQQVMREQVAGMPYSPQHPQALVPLQGPGSQYNTEMNVYPHYPTVGGMTPHSSPNSSPELVGSYSPGTPDPVPTHHPMLYGIANGNPMTNLYTYSNDNTAPGLLPTALAGLAPVAPDCGHSFSSNHHSHQAQHAALFASPAVQHRPSPHDRSPPFAPAVFEQPDVYSQTGGPEVIMTTGHPSNHGWPSGQQHTGQGYIRVPQAFAQVPQSSEHMHQSMEMFQGLGSTGLPLGSAAQSMGSTGQGFQQLLTSSESVKLAPPEGVSAPEGRAVLGTLGSGPKLSCRLSSRRLDRDPSWRSMPASHLSCSH